MEFWITKLCLLVIIKFVSTCRCNKTHGKNNTDHFDNRHMEKVGEETTVDYYENSTEFVTFDPLTVIDTYFNLNETDLMESNSDLSDSILELNETIFDATVTNINIEDLEITTEMAPTTRRLKSSPRVLSKKCPHYKRGNFFDVKKMADVWQIVYYRMPHKLKCFKIHIKLLDRKIQQHNAKIYGNFNNTVFWRKCHLEIKTGDKSDTNGRRHFLQGALSDKGVMDNIIIEEEHYDNSSYLSLHRESPDQWLVIKNLLIMRDCDTGDIVVFTRVPLEPKRGDVLDALMLFGETRMNGTMACDSDEDQNWIKYDESVIADT